MSGIGSNINRNSLNNIKSGVNQAGVNVKQNPAIVANTVNLPVSTPKSLPPSAPQSKPKLSPAIPAIKSSQISLGKAAPASIQNSSSAFTGTAVKMQSAASVNSASDFSKSLANYGNFFTTAHERINKKNIDLKFLLALKNNMNAFEKECQANRKDPADLFASHKIIDIFLLRDLSNIGDTIAKLSHVDLNNANISALPKSVTDNLIKLFELSEKAASQNKFQGDSVWKVLQDNNIPRKVFHDVKAVKNSISNISNSFAMMHNAGLIHKAKDISRLPHGSVKISSNFSQEDFRMIKKFKSMMQNISTSAESASFKELAKKYDFDSFLIDYFDEALFSSELSEISNSIILNNSISSQGRLSLDSVVSSILAAKNNPDISSKSFVDLDDNELEILSNIYLGCRSLADEGVGGFMIENLKSKANLPSATMSEMEALISVADELKNIKKNIYKNNGQLRGEFMLKIKHKNAIGSALDKYEKMQEEMPHFANFVTQASGLSQDEIAHAYQLLRSSSLF